MRRTAPALVGLLAALLLVLAVAPGGALAQEDTTNDTTADQEAPLGFEQRVDDRVILADWSYDRSEERFALTFDVNRTAVVTISEVVGREEDSSGTFAIQERMLEPGQTTVHMPARPGPSDEAAVTITTSRSVDAGQGVFVTTGQSSSNPFSTFGGTQGLFVGIVLSCVFALLATVTLLWRESSGVEVAG